MNILGYEKVLEIVKELMDDILLRLERELVRLVDFFKTSNSIGLFVSIRIIVFDSLEFIEILKGGDQMVLHIDKGFDEFIDSIFLIGWFEKLVKLGELTFYGWA